MFLSIASLNRGWRWALSGVLGFILGLLAVLTIFPEKEKHFPRWPESTSGRFSRPLRREPFHPGIPEAGAPGREIPREADGWFFKGRLLDGASSLPIAGAVVSIHEDPGAAVRADGEGRFDLEILAPPPASLLIQPDGYPQAHLAIEEIPDAVVDIRLFRSMSLLFLVVDDVTAAPIEGAMAAIDPPAGSGGAATDRDGLTGPIPMRPYLRLAREPDGTFRCLPEVLGAAVDARGYRTLRARLQADGELTPILLRLQPLAILRGRVVDRGGAPVPGAAVAVRWHFDVGKDTSEFDVAGTRSDALGAFELSVPAGREGFVDVGAGKIGYAPAAAKLDLESAGRRGDLVLALQPGHDLEGRVTDQSGRPIADVRLTLDGEPFDAVPAVLRMEFGGEYGSPVGMTASDEDGYFAAVGLFPGNYTVRALARDHAPIEPLAVAIPHRGELRIVLDAGESLSGVVVDPENGIAVTGATVLVNAPDGSEEERAFDVDQDGQFLITGLRGDRLYDLLSIARGYRHENVRKAAPGTSDLVIIMEPIPKDVPGRSGRLSIRVTSLGHAVHASRGTFLVGIFDQAGKRQGSYKRRKPVNGVIAIDDLPEGVFDVTVGSDRYAPAVLEDVVIDPEGAPIAVEVKPGCEVSGDESPPGSLPAGALIELRDPDHAAPFSIVHRRSGAWRLGVLERGRLYTLSITEKGSLLGTQVFVADCGASIPLRLAPAAR